jgi:hypothetical protein
MSCQEILDQLPLLIYGELDSDEAAACRRHLAHCRACRAELAAIERTHHLLDRAPVQRSQVDLAAVCLRIAARERRGRSIRRIAYGVTAAAAAIALLLALRFLNLAVEPGRLVVAWTPREFHTEPTVPAIEGERSTTIQIASDDKEPPQIRSAAAPDRAFASSRHDYDPTLSADPLGSITITDLGLRRAYSPGQAAAMRYAQPMHERSAPATPTTNYNDLRRELLGPSVGAPTPRSVPDA